MNRISVKQIHIYTRPVEVQFHIELARQLASRFPNVPVRFYTYFIWAHNRVCAAGLESHYMPECLAKLDVSQVSDSHLDAVDRELAGDNGANLMLQLNAERFRPGSADEQQDFLRRHVAFLGEAIKPGTLSVASMYDHFFYWLAGSLANARDGAHFSFLGAPTPSGRVQALRTAWDQWIGPEDPDADRLYDEAIANMSVPPEARIAYMAPVVNPPLLERLPERLDEIKADLSDQYNGSNFKGAGFNWPDALRAWWRRCLPAEGDHPFDIKSLSELRAFPHRFVYLPLHLEPEASIFMYSPFLRDQLEMCRLVSQSVPPNTWVLAKENPKMLGLRSTSFVQSIKSIPNVKYVHPRVSSYELINRSDITLTLSGTAGLEAKLLGKRVGLMAHPPYAFCLSAEERIGTQFTGRQIRALIERPGEALSRGDWRRLVRGTFLGKAVPVWEGNRIQIDPAAENAAAYVRYITGCLDLPKDTQRQGETTPF